MAGKVYLTPLFRAAWADMMAGDKRLSPVAVRIGIVIGGYFNSGTAETYVGQPTIAKRLGISARTVWNGIHQLEDCGHIFVRKGGRASNTYTMPVEKVAAYCEIYNRKPRSRLRDLGSEISQGRDEISQSDAENIAAGCEQTLSTNSNNNSTAGNVVRCFEPHAAAWQEVKAHLVTRYDAHIVANWFAQLQVIRVNDGVCTMRAPGPFVANYIKNNMLPGLLLAWQAVDQKISDIKFETNRTTRPARQGAPREALSIAKSAANGGAA